MTIKHKFQNHKWNNNFWSEDSILLSTLYKPEVIFIGTFNPNWLQNNADIFYGRNMYYWTIMANLFIHNRNKLLGRRKPDVNGYNDIVTLYEIFRICEKAKITFADIIKGTNTDVKMESNFGDRQLDCLGEEGLLDDNVGSICNYINQTKSIKFVYFTFKSGNWLSKKIKEIRDGIKSINKDNIGSIYTPIGMRLKNSQGYPKRALTLVHCWVWNGEPNHINHPKKWEEYTHLNHEWLIRDDVNPNKFCACNSK